MRIVGFLLLGCFIGFGQLPAPNAMGVSAGHDIMVVKDLEASNKFWTALGGEPATFGTLKMTKFPGVLFLIRQGESKGGTEGSTVDFIGFKVKNMKQAMAKWSAAGLRPYPGSTANEAFFMAPDDIKVRVTEDASLGNLIAADMLQLNVPNPAEAKAWYEKWFGKDIPGSRLTFVEAKGMAGTKGRAFDRVGFEVKNVEQFCKNLEAGGIMLDGAYRKAANMALAVCVLTDPWGTYIELSEGLAAVK